MSNSNYCQPVLLKLRAPCDACPSADRCRRESIACATFFAYVMGDRWEPKRLRSPTHGTFLKLFPRVNRRPYT